jgi:MFS family permease
MSRDVSLLFAARATRMFAYGALAVILVLYLAALGLDGAAIGLLLSLTLAGDTLIALWLTTRADRFGRRRTLLLGALLMAVAGVIFGVADALPVLILAATIGVISPTGSEVGPFLAVEQAALSQTTPGARRTSVFAWYNLAGLVATAFGALTAGTLVTALRSAGAPDVDAYRAIVLGYGVIGMGLAGIFIRVSPAIEPPAAAADDATIRGRFGLHRSRGVVGRLSALFALDAFAGGFVIQSLLAYWFYVTFNVPEAALGGIFFAANLLAGASALAAARIARRFGLINTMVFTHLPSNVLLVLVPFMPTVELAVLMLLARYSISQMDVPTRQSYTMAVVDPDERSAAAGVTGVARSLGTAAGTAVGAPLLGVAGLAALPFFISGGLKVVYDLALWRAFRSRPAPEDPTR